jgi:hypothetical protein
MQTKLIRSSCWIALFFGLLMLAMVTKSPVLAEDCPNKGFGADGDKECYEPDEEEHCYGWDEDTCLMLACQILSTDPKYITFDKAGWKTELKVAKFPCYSYCYCKWDPILGCMPNGMRRWNFSQQFKVEKECMVLE